MMKTQEEKKQKNTENKTGTKNDDTTRAIRRTGLFIHRGLIGRR